MRAGDDEERAYDVLPLSFCCTLLQNAGCHRTFLSSPSSLLPFFSSHPFNHVLVTRDMAMIALLAALLSLFLSSHNDHGDVHVAQFDTRDEKRRVSERDFVTCVPLPCLVPQSLPFLPNGNANNHKTSLFSVSFLQN